MTEATPTLDPAAATPATPAVSNDSAAASTTAVGTEATTTDKAAESTSPQVTADANQTESLISEAEYEGLKDNPEALRKRLNEAFTQKTQALAEQRKELGAWMTIAEAFREDPEAAKAAFLRNLGVDPSVLQTAPAAKEIAQTTQVSAVDEAVAKMKSALEKFGLEELAPELMAPIRQLAEDAIGQRLKPIEDHTQRLMSESAQREMKIVLDRFTEKRPDWKQHEAQMMKIAQGFKVATDANGKPLMDEATYLDTLYVLANQDGMVRSEVQKAINRINQAAQTAEQVPGSRVTGDKVQSKAPKGAGFREALEAARRGETWD